MTLRSLEEMISRSGTLACIRSLSTRFMEDREASRRSKLEGSAICRSSHVLRKACDFSVIVCLDALADAQGHEHDAEAQRACQGVSIIRRIVVEGINEPPPGLWSNCLVSGNQVFIAGLVALDNNGHVVGRGDVEAQADFIFGNIRRYMEGAGGSLKNIAAMTVFVTDMRHRPGFLVSRQKHFTGDFPCSTLVAVTSLIDPDLLVEINAIGVLE